MSRLHVWMTRAALTGFCALVPLGCGGGGARDGPASSCAAALRVQGVLMREVAKPDVGAPPARGTVTARYLGCDREKVVTLPRFRGIDPRLGLPDADLGSQRTFWVPASHRLPVLRGYPLHRALFGHRRIWPSIKGRSCPHRTVRGRLRPLVVLGVELGLRRGSHVIDVQMTRDVRFRGPMRLGQPYVRAGDRVVVSGRQCRRRTLRAQRLSVQTS